MKILGIANDLDAGAALVVDGVLVGCANEERFSRKKLDSRFPSLTIAWLLEEAGLQAGDIEAVCYGWSNGLGLDGPGVRDLIRARAASAAAEDPAAEEICAQRVDTEIKNQKGNVERFLRGAAEFGWDDRVVMVEHHAAHAAAAFLTSSFDEALVVTCDGKGDFLSATAAVGSGHSVDRREALTTFDSLGYFYGILTELLGFRPQRHEGKVTGLAAYAEPGGALDVVRRMVSFEDGLIRAHPGPFYKPFFTTDLPALREALEPFSREQIASAAQQVLEEVMVGWVGRHVEETGQANLALAGGVFGNVKLNQWLAAIPGVSSVFIHPGMGDGGLPLGACLHHMADVAPDELPARPLAHVFLGPASSDAEIEAACDGLSAERVDDPVAAAVEELVAGGVVGWFQGRMEYGPRALCHRSILVHPRDPSVNEWLNARLDRTEFMPFAPVTTAELAPRCFKGWTPDDRASRFMTITYDVTDEFAASAPATVHVDRTARPQVVFAEDEPDVHRLITAYHQATGDLALINTSFNHHEEPIVCTPADALASLAKGNVDVLLMGPFRIRP